MSVTRFVKGLKLISFLLIGMGVFACSEQDKSPEIPEGIPEGTPEQTPEES